MKTISDRELGAFILDVQRTVARIELMIALDNLKLSLQKAKEALFPPKVKCDICEREMLIEDSYTCERCGKSVCEDHIVGLKRAEDDFENACTDCLERF